MIAITTIAFGAYLINNEIHQETKIPPTEIQESDKSKIILNEILILVKRKNNEEIALSEKFDNLIKSRSDKIGVNNMKYLAHILDNSSTENQYTCGFLVQKVYSVYRDESDRDLDKILIKKALGHHVIELFLKKGILRKNINDLCMAYTSASIAASDHLSFSLILNECEENNINPPKDFLYKVANFDPFNEFSVSYKAIYILLKKYSPSPDELGVKLNNPNCAVRIKNLDNQNKDSEHYKNLIEIAQDLKLNTDDKLLVQKCLWAIKPHDPDPTIKIVKSINLKSIKIKLLMENHFSKTSDSKEKASCLISFIKISESDDLVKIGISMLANSKYVDPDDFVQVHKKLKNSNALQYLPLIAYNNENVLLDDKCLLILSELLDFKKVGAKSKMESASRYYLYAALSKSLGWSGNEKILIDEFYNGPGGSVIPALLKSKNINKEVLNCLSDALICEKYYKLNFLLSIRNRGEFTRKSLISKPYPLPMMILEEASTNKKIKFTKKTLEEAKILLNKELATIKANQPRENFRLPQVPHFERALKIVDDLLLESKP